MTEAYSQGNAIEGAKVYGSSRDPLVPLGLVRYRGHTCYRYIARFNVKSQVGLPIQGEPIFEPQAATELNASIKCDKAIVHSLDRKPRCGLEHASSTHKASGWHFHKQTGVVIDQPHQDLVDGMRKRLEPLLGPKHLPPKR